MDTGCLVIADADKIHEYVFSPRKLKLIRGGSAIQDQLNKGTLLSELQKLGRGNLKGTEILDTPTVEDGGDWEVVFAGGGTVMCHFRERQKAEGYCWQVQRVFHEHTGTATITTSITDWDGSFAKTLPRARARLEMDKGGRVRRFFSGHTPYWKNCGGCSAESKGPYEDGHCRACHQRFLKSESRYFKAVNARLGGLLKQPEDFETIAAGGYLAMVYIDGDSMGEYLQTMGARSKQEYRALSRKVQDAVEGGVIQACAKISKHLDAGAAAPFEILLVGGDDAIVMLAGRHAIDFLIDFDTQYKLQRSTYSAGIVWAHHHFPISLFLELTEALLRSAKRLQDVNSVDYRVISEAMARHEMARTEDPTTAKPYPVGELEKLRNGLARLKSEGVPANKVNELYRIAFEPEHQGKVDYDFLLSRLSKEHRARVEDTIGKELRDPATGKTKAADLVELWSFVDGTTETKGVAAAGAV